MRIHTFTTWQIEDEIGVYTTLDDRYFEYDGPVEEAKKGREQLNQNMKTAATQAGTNNANSNAAYNTAQSLLKEDIGSTTPGSLTPAAQATLAADNDNIYRVYNGMKQQAYRTLGQRGFNDAPSGFSIAAMNGINNAQANDETNAYRQGQLNTQNQRNFATQEEGNLSGQQGQLGTANLGQSTNAAVARNQMGSTAGDILSGVGSALGGIVPGIGLISGLTKGITGTPSISNTPFGQSNGYGGTLSS